MFSYRSIFTRSRSNSGPLPTTATRIVPFGDGRRYESSEGVVVGTRHRASDSAVGAGHPWPLPSALSLGVPVRPYHTPLAAS